MNVAATSAPTDLPANVNISSTTADSSNSKSSATTITIITVLVVVLVSTWGIAKEIGLGHTVRP